MNIPGSDKPLQPMKVWYGGGYAQDEWRPRQNMTITAGVQIRHARVSTTPTVPNPNADALTFRDEAGTRGEVSERAPARCAKVLWSPRVALQLGRARASRTRRCAAAPASSRARRSYVWISNQIGNTGVFTGFDQFEDNVTNTAVQPRSDAVQAERRHRRAGREL